MKRTHQHQTYKANDPASPTPAADAKNVYVFFPDFGLISYTFDGKERWRHPLGPFENFYGISSSPVIAEGLVLLLCDQTRGSFLMALDKETGRQKWKTERSTHTEGWSVPVIYKDQLLAVGSARVDSYFLSTGATAGIEPAAAWQALRGEWLAPFNITGCCHEVPQSLRCAPLGAAPLRLRLRALRVHGNPRYVLRPYAPARGIGSGYRAHVPPKSKACAAMASPSPQGFWSGASRVIGLAPPDQPIRPQGAPRLSPLACSA